MIYLSGITGMISGRCDFHSSAQFGDGGRASRAKMGQADAVIC